MSAPSIGRLRSRLTLEAATPTSDDAGGVTEVWSMVAMFWGQVRAVHGAERFAAGRMAATVTHTITIRHRDGVVAGQRLRLGSRILDILAVRDVDERRRHLTILAEERNL
jgi:SPP1 family predicted phage head-tail adaptor